MEEKKLERDLIFFTPGKPGAVFTYRAGNTGNDTLLNQTVDHLEYDTDNHIQWVEERRVTPWVM